jgi:hypothetical protein
MISKPTRLLPPSHFSLCVCGCPFGGTFALHCGAGRAFGTLSGCGCCLEWLQVEPLMCFLPGLLPFFAQLVSASDFFLPLLHDLIPLLCSLPPPIAHMLSRIQTSFFEKIFEGKICPRFALGTDTRRTKWGVLGSACMNYMLAFGGLAPRVAVVGYLRCGGLHSRHIQFWTRYYRHV